MCRSSNQHNRLPLGQADPRHTPWLSLRPLQRCKPRTPDAETKHQQGKGTQKGHLSKSTRMTRNRAGMRYGTPNCPGIPSHWQEAYIQVPVEAFAQALGALKREGEWPTWSYTHPAGWFFFFLPLQLPRKVQTRRHGCAGHPLEN